MTKNQIEYQKLLETKRHNLVQDYISENSLNVNRGQAAEVKRHNKVSEEQALAQLGINQRTVDIKGREVDVASQNALTNAFNADTNRYNAEVNAQNARTNERNADTNSRNADTNWYNAQSNRISAGAAAQQASAAVQNAATQAAVQQETARHNTAVERLQSLDSASNRWYQGEQGKQIASTIKLNNARVADYEAQIDKTKSQTALNKLEWLNYDREQLRRDVSTVTGLVSGLVKAGGVAISMGG